MKSLSLYLLNFLFFTGTAFAQIAEVLPNFKAEKDSFAVSENNFSPEKLGAEEIFIKFSYAGLVNSTVIAYYYNNRFFFPFKEFCDNFEINSKIGQKEISGFIGKKTNSYRILLNEKKVVLRDTTLNFTFENYIHTEFDYYFNSEFYKKIFGAVITTDFSTLTANVQSKKPLPILQRFQREKSYEYISQKKADNAKLLFPRERRWINGGIFDYNAGYKVGDAIGLGLFYNFRLGGELFGGDAQISTSGEFNSEYQNNNLNYLWRYVFDKNKYLRTISIGDISLNGIYPLNYKGIRISNDQVEPRRTFETHRVYEKTKPNWTVEIYVSNQLIDVAKADAVGDFYFDMPLSYGTTLLQLKFYGPGGEYYERTRLYQTPYYLLRPKEFIYFIDYGNLDVFNKIVGGIKSGYGINKWLTTEFGYQYYENDISENIFYNSTTARLNGEYLINLTVAPQAYYKLAANVLYYSQTSIGFEYTRYTQYGFINPGKMDYDIGGNFFIPFRFESSQINLKGSANYTGNSNLKLMDYSLGTSASMDGFNPSISYNFSKSISGSRNFTREYIDLGFSYFISNFFKEWNFSGTLLTFRSYFDTKKNQFENYSIGLSTTIKNNARIQLSHYYNFFTSQSNLQLQLIIYLDNIQLHSTLGSSNFRIGALGSIAYDKISGEIEGFNRAQVGRSSALFRLFVDANGDGKYQKGEEIIKGGKILMGTSVIAYQSNGLIRARELDPYTIYTVDVDETSIKNPLLVPGIKRFSFVADPNAVKYMEIPFYIAGEIDGKVKRKFGNNYTPVSGIKIHIKNLDTGKITTISTYSDGNYYYFGLRPGNYEAYLDKEHLQIMGIKKEIKPIKFNIEPKENGDIIMDADFIIE